MCITTPTAPKQTPAPTTGERGRWLQKDAAERIRARESAMVEFTVERRQADGSYRDYSEVYFVSFLEATKEWLLSHDVEGSGSGAGFIDYRLSRDLWDCTCPSNQYGRTPCKHRRLLSRALKAIGVEPMTGV